eukprot:GHVU01076973.1.p1 GENE.GHVU01076973.1~~GHVU01076973.1.p1  ORF type:complete len:196 (+),score=20.77 GHVU01076973.1:1538-2125(+)
MRGWDGASPHTAPCHEGHNSSHNSIIGSAAPSAVLDEERAKTEMMARGAQQPSSDRRGNSVFPDSDDVLARLSSPPPSHPPSARVGGGDIASLPARPQLGDAGGHSGISSDTGVVHAFPMAPRGEPWGHSGGGRDQGLDASTRRAGGNDATATAATAHHNRSRHHHYYDDYDNWEVMRDDEPAKDFCGCRPFTER